MAKITVNTPYQLTAQSDMGGIKFTATRRYNSATYNGHTEFGFLGWEVKTYKSTDAGWKQARFKDYPETIGNKKDVIAFLASRPIFSQASNELLKK